MKNIKINKDLLQQYFYYGIVNKEELEEGLLFYILSKINKERATIEETKYKEEDNISVKNMSDDEKKEYYRKCREEENKKDEEMKLMHVQKMVQEAIKIYKQYYRFIVFPDNRENYNIDIKKENEEQIEEKIRAKIYEHKQQGKLEIYPTGIYYNRKQEEIYIEKWILIDIKTYKMEHYKNWTQDVYEILLELGKLEKENIQSYQEIWIDVRLRRAENRNPKDEVEISNIQTVKKIFDDKKQRYKDREDER